MTAGDGPFLLRRLDHAVFVVWGVVTVVFFILRLTGDPAAFLVDQTATREEIAHARHLLGLDRPLYVQYLDFLARRPARRLRPLDPRAAPGHADGARAPLAGHRRAGAGRRSCWRCSRSRSACSRRPTSNGAVDHLSRLGSLFLQSMPSFWLGLHADLALRGRARRAAPAFGSGTLRHLILPALTLAAAPLAQNVRLIRSGHARGPPARLRPHGARQGPGRARCRLPPRAANAAGPFITVSGLSLGFMLSGTIIIETVFSWPGSAASSCRPCPAAISRSSRPACSSSPCIFVAVNLIVDVLHGLLDPRARVFDVRPADARARDTRRARSAWLVIAASVLLAAARPGAGARPIPSERPAGPPDPADVDGRRQRAAPARHRHPRP